MVVGGKDRGTQQNQEGGGIKLNGLEFIFFISYEALIVAFKLENSTRPLECSYFLAQNGTIHASK